MIAARRGLADRLAALPERRQEQLQDTGLAVALAAVNVVSVLPYRAQLHPLWLALVLLAGQALPLIWRRSAAIGVGAVIGAARVSYDKIGFGFAPLPLGPAIAVYTVFDRRGPALRLATAVLVVVGVAISLDAPGHNEPYEAIFQGLIFATAMAAGTLSRARRGSLHAAQSRAERAEAELDHEAARAAAAERARIARELHDVVAHHVSLMAVQAEAAASLLPAQPARARQSVDIIGETARQALTELRRLLGVLRGPAERSATSPAASLTDLGAVLATGREAGLPGEYEVPGPPAALAPGIELTAFRIVQEALTNTLRHADAVHAQVTVAYEPGYVTLAVTDSGPRRQEPPATSGSGFGLAWHRGAGRVLRRQPHGRANILSRLRPVRSASRQMNGPITVVVADDQELVRAGFCVILGAADGITVVGEAANGGQAVALAAEHQPDVVLMDVRMPEMDGLEAARLITSGADGSGQRAPKVVMLTTFDLDDYVYAALRAGASGFLLKDSPRADLIAAVRAAAAGNALLAPSVTRRLIEAFARRPPETTPSPSQLASVTARERDVLMLIARGRSNAEIAAALFVSEATVKTHVGSLLAKLGLRDRVQAVILAYETGLIVPGDAPT